MTKGAKRDGRSGDGFKLRVFIQNEAGSTIKNYHNEQTLEWIRSATVSLAYPFPYGFILGTTAQDECNVDCFVITARPLQTGQTVTCQVMGLMEQFEDGAIDHNMLAILDGERISVDEHVEARLSTFVKGVFAHVPGKQIEVGRFLDADAAMRHIAAHRR